MTELDAVGQGVESTAKVNWGGFLGVLVLLLTLLTFGCSGGGDKEHVGKSDQKTVAPNTAANSVAPLKSEFGTTNPTASSSTTGATITPVKTAPGTMATPPPASLGLPLNEFCRRFNTNSEHVKSKLRIKNLEIVAGTVQDSFKHVFNENLYITGKVNKVDGAVAEITLDGVLNGSLATTVDLNLSIGSIVTAFAPSLSPEGRDGMLNALGININNSDIYNLNKKVTKGDIVYWTKSSRKTGLRFGARSARGD